MTSCKSIVIIGPTASGKSGLAIQIAQKFDGEIISADSRQIFRNMDIGTGKVPRDTKFAQFEPESTLPNTKFYQPYYSAGVAHYLIDILHPRTIWNAAQFVSKARRIRTDICARGKLPIIAGGTLFWAQALAENQQFAQIAPDKDLRKSLNKLNATKLFAQLEKINPKKAQEIAQKNEQNNRHRLIRAIEIAKVNSPQNAIPENHPTNTELEIAQIENTLIIALIPPKEELHAKIQKRFDQWISAGFLDEVRDLHFVHGVPWSRIAQFGLEYKWAMRHLRGQCTAEEMRNGSLQDLRRYAKRQLTWIRRWQKQGTQIHTAATSEEAFEIAQKFITK